MPVDILAKRRRLGIAFQEGWGSPNADNINIGSSVESRMLLANSGDISINPDVTISYMDIGATNGLIRQRNRSLSDYKSGLPRISFTMYGNYEDLSYLLLLALQRGTSNDSTYNFTKNIWSVFDSDVLDFTNVDLPATGGFNGTKGGLVTVFTDSITGSDGVKLINAFIDKLNITIDFNSRGEARFMKIVGEFVGSKMETEKNFSGTWTQPTNFTSKILNNSTLAQVALSGIGGLSGNICCKSYELTLNNNTSSDCKTTGGEANNYKVEPEYNCNVEIPYNTLTHDVFDDFRTGDEATIQLTSGTLDTDIGAISITSKGRLVDNPFGYDGNYHTLKINTSLEVVTGNRSVNCFVTDNIDLFSVGQ